MILSVCVGSACHIKGSYEVIKVLERLIEKEKLEDKIVLKASFCLGNCTESVSVSINETNEIMSFSPSNAEVKFYELIKRGI